MLGSCRGGSALATSETLAEDPIQFPAPQGSCNSSFRVSDALLWAPWAPGMLVIHGHTCRQNTLTKINKSE